MFRMYLAQWRRNFSNNATMNRQKSTDCFARFKAMAFKMNGDKEPNEDFWSKQFLVRHREYRLMGKDKRLFYDDLNRVVKKGTPVWATNNKKWFEAHGVFSAWEKHCEALGGRPRAGGLAGEPKMTDHHHRRLRGTYFVDEVGEEWRVLLVEWDDDYERNYAYSYDAKLGDPPGTGQNSRYTRADGSRWPVIEDCENSTVEQVDDWIAARHKPKKRARTT